MKTNTEDYIKNQLVESQERVRDFRDISHEVENPEIKQFLREYAGTEDIKAQQIKDSLDTEYIDSDKK
nr:hypothetical protein [uncultured Aminipila sp.]